MLLLKEKFTYGVAWSCIHGKSKLMKTMSEFTALPLEEQVSYIWSHGKFTLSRSVDSFGVNRYSLGEFFAEVWFDKQQNWVHLVTSFSARTK